MADSATSTKKALRALARRFGSVRVRTTLSAVVVTALCLVLSAAATIYAQRTALTNNIAATNELRSEDIAAELKTNGPSPQLATQLGDDHFIQIVDASRNVVSSSPALDGQTPISSFEPRPNQYKSIHVEHLPVGGDADYQIVTRGVATTSGFYTIYVAANLEAVTEGTFVLTIIFAITIPILLLIVGVMTWILTGRSLRPVEQIRRQVAEIESRDLSQRVPEPDTHDEIAELARTMNAMLARLESSTNRQRQFVADASHELRSPLTAIRSRLEVDLAHPEKADYRETEREVLGDAISMQRLIEDLLRLARADSVTQNAAVHVPVDLDEIVLSEARRLRLAVPHTVDTSAVSGAQVNGDADDLTRAVRNLLDNAGRHASNSIVVSLEESNGDAVLTIADDGSGVPDAERERIFERFARLDEARSRDAGGTGLGLAIVKEIVDQHSGSITVTNVPGACFRVTIPTSAL